MTAMGVSLGRGTNGLNKPSADAAADRQTLSARGLRYETSSSRETSLPPPPPPSWAQRRDRQRFFPARSPGVRLRRRAAGGLRAAASFPFIGFLRGLFPSPKPALSFFSALFSRPFLPCPGIPLAAHPRQEADVLTLTPNFYTYCYPEF